ncbi:MAG: hypothetical protein II318_08090 [Bacteroidales bacterium]|nr:hypothetical protein [Bacteroidales bacterium]
MSSKGFLFCVFLLLLAYIASTESGYAQIKEAFDSIYYKSVSDSVQRYIQSHPNRFKPEQNRLKATPMASVSYVTEDGFGFIVGMTGQYRNGLDISAPLSLFSTVGYVSTKGSFKLAVGGTNYAVNGKSRLEYKASGYYDKRYFWGIGYDNGVYGGNKSRYSELGANISLMYRFLLSPKFNIAPLAGYNYINASDLSSKSALAGGLPLVFNGIYLGGEVVFDTRDDHNSPQRGVCLNLRQKVYPVLTSNRGIFYQTTFVADLFFKGWKGAVFAVDLFSESNYGDSPWFVWTPIGGDVRMRGYYKGRYRDRNTLIAQLELRQSIYRGHGAVLWCGAANIFPSYKEIDLKKTLPNYGIGYRYDLGGNIFKFDVGFGKNREWGISAGLNHAF